MDEKPPAAGADSTMSVLQVVAVALDTNGR
jgi:hypothetical protein